MKKVLIVLAAGLFIIACGNKDKRKQLDKLKQEHDKITEQIRNIEDELKQSNDSLSNRKSKYVSVLEISKQPFNHYVQIQGKVDGEENVGVFPKTQAVVTKILVNQGDAVKKDQVLIQLDDEIMQKTLTEVKSQLSFVTEIYDKQKALWDKKIGSEVQYLTAKNNKESLENKIATLLDQIDMCKIKSPIDGTVEDIPLKIGQFASPASPLPAVRVVNFSKVKVVADVAEAYSSKIKVGNNVIIYFPDFNKEIPSVITFASKYINPVNRSFVVESRLNPSDAEYRANMVAVIKINDYSKKESINIPVNVILSDNSGKHVFIAETVNNELRAKKVKITEGDNYNGIVEILGGLKEGDKIITSGYQDLEDGQLIQL